MRMKHAQNQNMLLSHIITFLCGAACMGMFWAWSFLRFIERDKADPLITPPTRRIAEFVRAVRKQIYEWQHAGEQEDRRAYENAREVMKTLEVWTIHPSLWMVDRGFVMLPNGSAVPLRKTLQEVDAALVAAYLALDDAAARLLDHADCLPKGETEQPGGLLHSRKYAYESEIVKIAQLLGLDPDANSVARHGGAKLWRRQQRRIFPNTEYGREPELELQH